jgi:aspartyl-tRNA(Asn)/glutamyl-tRNA(Gln) amidotransferase subunit C
MSGSIKKEDIEHLAKLARIDLTGAEEGKLLHDAEAILGYFEELKGADTDGISPMAGAAMAANITDRDEANNELIQKGIESFPESERGYLKVPGVMKNSDE